MKIKKVVVLCNSFYPDTNAAASRVYERLKFWDNPEFQFTIVTSKPRQNSLPVLPENISLIRLPSTIFNSKIFGLRLINELYFSFMVGVRLIFLKKPDIYFVSSPPFLMVILGQLMASIFGKKLILEISDLWPDSLAELSSIKKSGVFFRILKWFEIRGYKKSSQVICLTPGIEKQVRQNVPDEKKILCAKNGFRKDLYFPTRKNLKLRDELGLQSKVVIGYYGALGRSQNIIEITDIALKAESLGLRHIHFLIAGSGEQENLLRERVENIKVNNLTFLGQIPKHEMAKYWSVLDLSLIKLVDIPIFKTAIPSKLIESIGMGIPVLAIVPESDCKNLIEEHEIGIVYSPSEAFNSLDFMISKSKLVNEVLNYKENVLAVRYLFTRENQANLILERIRKC